MKDVKVTSACVLFQVQRWHGVWDSGDVWVCGLAEQNFAADSESNDGRCTCGVPRAGLASCGAYKICKFSYFDQLLLQLNVSFILRCLV